LCVHEKRKAQCKVRCRFRAREQTLSRPQPLATCVGILELVFQFLHIIIIIRQPERVFQQHLLLQEGREGRDHCALLAHQRLQVHFPRAPPSILVLVQEFQDFPQHVPLAGWTLIAVVFKDGFRLVVRRLSFPTSAGDATAPCTARPPAASAVSALERARTAALDFCLRCDGV